MASRKNLKKNIASVCEGLLVECLAAKLNTPAVAEEDIENIAKTILIMQLDFTNRLSHVDKKQVRRFFAQYYDDLAASTNEIVDAIYHLN